MSVGKRLGPSVTVRGRRWIRRRSCLPADCARDANRTTPSIRRCRPPGFSEEETGSTGPKTTLTPHPLQCAARPTSRLFNAGRPRRSPPRPRGPKAISYQHPTRKLSEENLMGFMPDNPPSRLVSNTPPKRPVGIKSMERAHQSPHVGIGLILPHFFKA